MSNFKANVIMFVIYAVIFCSIGRLAVLLLNGWNNP